MEAIKNVLDVPTNPDRYHIRYIDDVDAGDIAASVAMSGDLDLIEDAIKTFATQARSAIISIGLLCVAIDREHLYKQGGFTSYLDYMQHLEDAANIPPQTLSDAKRIAETYLDHFQKLQQYNFRVVGNAHKLRFLDIAVERHGEDAYKKLIASSLREFQSWAASDPSERSDVNKTLLPKILVDKMRIMVDGVSVLNFAPELPLDERTFLTGILGAAYKIRKTGNLPFILDTYDAGEQRAVMNFLKKRRASK